MEIYKKPERREFGRVEIPILVSYRIRGELKTDISHAKNISEGGLLFTSDKDFDPNTVLVLKLKLPLSPEWFDIIGEVAESKEVKKNLIYEIRVRFIDIAEEAKKTIAQLVEKFSKTEEEEEK